MMYAGDHVALYPVNDQELVNRLGELLDVDLDTVISLVNVDGECFPVTLLGEIVKHLIYFIIFLVELE